MPSGTHEAVITVERRGDGHSLTHGDFTAPCLVGKSGIVDAGSKREGDGATPAGTWPLREVLYRADRLDPPDTSLRTGAILETDGWCDDPDVADYNRRVSLPFTGSHERLWRGDGVYDVIVPLGYNDDPPEAGRGSAIFLHCLEEGRGHTEGCVAIGRQALLDLLARLGPDPAITIRG